MDRYKEFRFKVDVPKYIYPTGRAGKILAEYLKKGVLVTSYCDECEISYMPPTAYCPRCFQEIKTFKPVKRAFLDMYTVLRKDFYGREMEEPIVYGFIRFEVDDGIAEGGLIHRLKVEKLEDLEEGMEVIPIFKERDRKGLITDIIYFKPK